MASQDKIDSCSSSPLSFFPVGIYICILCTQRVQWRSRLPSRQLSLKLSRQQCKFSLDNQCQCRKPKTQTIQWVPWLDEQPKENDSGGKKARTRGRMTNEEWRHSRDALCYILFYLCTACYVVSCWSDMPSLSRSIGRIWSWREWWAWGHIRAEVIQIQQGSHRLQPGCYRWYQPARVRSFVLFLFVLEKW